MSFLRSATGRGHDWRAPTWGPQEVPEAGVTRGGGAVDILLWGCCSLNERTSLLVAR